MKKMGADEKVFVVRLNMIMNARGLSQNALAKQSGITRLMICKYCNGVCMPNIRALWRLCKALNCSADYLIGNSKYAFTADRVVNVIGG